VRGLSRKALVVTGLTKRYPGVTALDSVSLEVGEGEYFAVIGPSGSGKSTLLKCIAGLERPDSGSVYIFGRRVDGLPPEERGVGLIFQEIYLFPHMTARSNVVYAAVARGVGRAEDVAREALSAVGVEVRARSLPRELSLGEQQKVSLARALASGARLLLMDEPYGSMDPRTAAQLRYEVRRLAKSLGLTVIHVTHNQEEAMAVADRVAVMRRGKVEQVDSPEEVYFNPLTPFEAKFVADANLLPGKLVEVEGASGVAEVEGLGPVSARGQVGSRFKGCLPAAGRTVQRPPCRDDRSRLGGRLEEVGGARAAALPPQAGYPAARPAVRFPPGQPPRAVGRKRVQRG
jgi:ABC-type Fe3+/spermidine/putrescine transport system ATPase subunit